MNSGTLTRLPEAAFLIGYDVAKQKLTGSQKPELVRAAVLAELYLRGRLIDADGTAAVARHSPATGDPTLDAVVDDILGSSRPRAWKHWIRQAAKPGYLALQDRLVQERVITVREGRMLGLFPTHTVNVPDTRIVSRLITDARQSALAGRQADHIDPRQAALAALAAEAELNTVFTGRERRQYRKQIAALAEPIRPMAKAFRAVVVEDQASAAGG
jgi:hypothetical protein